jgi:hypothetical protein
MQTATTRTPVAQTHGVRTPHVDDWVRLTRDIPELELSAGELGIVRSMWCSPYLAFEVEFRPIGQTCETRCLLTDESVQVQEDVHAS